MKRDSPIGRRGRGGSAFLLLFALTLVAAAGFAVSQAHVHNLQHADLDCGLCAVGHAPLAATAPLSLSPPEHLAYRFPAAPTARVEDAVDAGLPTRGPPA